MPNDQSALKRSVHKRRGMLMSSDRHSKNTQLLSHQGSVNKTFNSCARVEMAEPVLCSLGVNAEREGTETET